MSTLYSNEIRFSVFFSNNDYDVHNFYFSPKRIKADTALEFLKIDKVLNKNIGYLPYILISYPNLCSHSLCNVEIIKRPTEFHLYADKIIWFDAITHEAKELKMQEWYDQYHEQWEIARKRRK